MNRRIDFRVSMLVPEGFTNKTIRGDLQDELRKVYPSRYVKVTVLRKPRSLLHEIFHLWGV